MRLEWAGFYLKQTLLDVLKFQFWDRSEIKLECDNSKTHKETERVNRLQDSIELTVHLSPVWTELDPKLLHLSKIAVHIFLFVFVLGDKTGK